MGSDNTKKNQILDYYFFQKEIKKLICGIYVKENEKFKKGYIVSSYFLQDWKSNMNYNSLNDYLDTYNIEAYNKDTQISIINSYLTNNKIKLGIIPYKNTFILHSARFLSQDCFPNMVNDTFFKELKKYKILLEEEKYIFKKSMFIIILEKYISIKIFLYLKEFEKLINLTFIFNDLKSFESKCNYFEKKNSNEIMDFLLTINIINLPKYVQYDKKSKEVEFIIYNEEEYINFKKNNYIQNKSIEKDNLIKSEKYNSFKDGIKPTYKINFNLKNEISFRGLENVGATCYMNATLQCLANIKPITSYLLDENKYIYLYDNVEYCLLTMEYIQVLIGLYCNESRTGSYCPKNFKNIISEYNPLFKGIQANDSKDLIIFLLEIINKELVAIHNKKVKEKLKIILIMKKKMNLMLK